MHTTLFIKYCCSMSSNVGGFKTINSTSFINFCVQFCSTRDKNKQDKSSPVVKQLYDKGEDKIKRSSSISLGLLVVNGG